MNKIEVEFIERYKQLDKICQDMYSTYQGVSEYISRMEDFYNEGTYYLNDWKNCYQTLKHLRWLRNQIVHQVGESECSKEDVQDVIDFYQGILHQQDPLAHLAKLKQEKIYNQTHKKEATYQKKNQNNNFLFYGIIIFIIVIFIVILYIIKI